MVECMLAVNDSIVTTLSAGATLVTALTGFVVVFIHLNRQQRKLDKVDSSIGVDDEDLTLAERIARIDAAVDRLEYEIRQLRDVL